MNKTTYADLLGRQKLRNVMKQYEESKLQQQCVAWFRAQYPEYAMLLTHPINEGNRGTRTQGAIHKAEGTVAGVPDLLLFIPSVFADGKMQGLMCHGLGIEMKTAQGKQSQQQKDFQKMFEAADYKYVVVRSLDEFREVVNGYLDRTSSYMQEQLTVTHHDITKAAEDREREKFYKVIGKKK